MINKLIIFCFIIFFGFFKESLSSSGENKEIENFSDNHEIKVSEIQLEPLLVDQKIIQEKPKFVPKSIADQLMYSTVSISTDIGVGTGFIFNFQPDGMESGYQIPCLVTNKHVIKDKNNSSIKANLARIIFHEKEIDKNEPSGKLISVYFNNNFNNLWIPHPREDVDLCILPFLNFFQKPEQQPFFRGISKNLIYSDEKLYLLSAAEEIVMIGYPNGLYDVKNNFPLFRRGICATHPAFDLKERPEFLIDIAAFHGSSGSPVFVYNKGFYKEGSSINIGNDRLIFMGALSSGPIIEAKGTVTGSMLPSFIDVRSTTNITMHLGYVIKSKMLLEFEKVLEDIIIKQKKSLETPKQ